MNTSPSYFEHCVIVCASAQCVLTGDRPSSRQYLRFAQDDLAEPDSARARINALANCKRAFHLQLSSILEVFGFRKAARLAFPDQMALAARCGIVAPRVLNKLNKLRNLTEHDYYVPSRTEAEDAVDIAELFLTATDWLIMQFPDSLEVASEDEDVEPAYRTLLQLRLEPGSGILVAEVTEYLGPAQALREMAAAIQCEWEAETAERTKQGIETVFIGDIKEEAYLAASRRMAVRRQFTVTPDDGAEFEKWVSYVVTNAA